MTTPAAPAAPGLPAPRAPSLRGRLMLGATLATTLALLAAAVAIDGLARAAIVDEFDAALLSDAIAVEAIAEFGHAGLEMELNPGQAPQFDRPAPGASYYEIRDAGGATMARSLSVRRTGRPLRDDPSPPTGPDARRTHDTAPRVDVTLPDGRPARLITFWFTPRLEKEDVGKLAAPPLLATVARDSGLLNADLDRVRAALACVWAIVTLALVGLIAAVIRLGLRPVSALAADIERIGRPAPGGGPAFAADAAGATGARIDVAGLPRELAPIAARLNELLDRLAAVFERERAFTADAAHELRTPIAGLRTALEVAAARPREPADYARVIGDCLPVLDAMHRSVDDLLFLARADARPVAPPAEPAAIAPLVEAAWAPLAAAAAARGLSLRATVEPPTLAWPVDRDRVTHLLGNLFDNAVRHADANGPVEVDARVADGRLAIRVANRGSCVAAADSMRVFDRFWRGDPARSRDDADGRGGHSGLGLSICRKIVNALGGTIAAESVADERFTIRIELP